jgi:hypothetical protein
MTCKKIMNEATSAMNPARFDWSSKLDQGIVKPAFPIRVLATKEGELYVSVTKAGISSFRMRQTLWMKIIGPLDLQTPLKEQLEGVGPWMKVEQTKDEMRKAKDSWDSKAKGEGAFVASVDLSDMLQNEAGVLTAIASRDKKALEQLCPNPFLMR